MEDYELSKPIPSEKNQQKFYIRLRSKVTNYVNKKEKHSTDKLVSYLLFAPDLFYLLMKALMDDRIDKKDRALIGSGILYFITPMDVLPEGLVGTGGFLDDIIVATFIVNTLLNKLPAHILEEHWVGDTSLISTLQKIAHISNKVLSKLPARSILSKFFKKKK